MASDIQQQAPIGVFDSGVGGLSVLKKIGEEHPAENLIYLADQAHVPYGERALLDVRNFTEEITRFFLKLEVKMIVVACNTASAAALHHLRQEFPQMPFVGMEPAVKPAAENTISGIVGVLATPATFLGELYESVVERFAQDVIVLQNTCPGLVGEIESGCVNSERARMILENALLPMIDRGIDSVVLGCTHYPFVMPMIQEIVGEDVRVIDPAPAIARQVGRVLSGRGINNPDGRPGSVGMFTSGDVERFGDLVSMLYGDSSEVEGVIWTESGIQFS